MTGSQPIIPLLQVENLCVFSRPQAKNQAPELLLEPLSFSLYPGERLTILGETGAGKSLLMQAIMGTLPKPLYHQGRIRIAGQDLDALPQTEREQLWGRRIALLPQEPWHALDPLMPSQEQVSEVYQCVKGRKPDSADHQATQDLLAVGLQGAEHKRPDQLSGGMAQRLAFCAATAAGASLILADEPTKGLDTSCREALVQLLCKKSTQGTLLTITHDVAVARQLGGRILVMKSGRLLDDGRIKQVLDDSACQYTRQLIEAEPARWPPYPLPNIQQATPILEAQELSKQRGNKRLFEHLSLQIRRGEILGLTGDSGCGKSTLGDILLGLLPADSGRVYRRGGFAPQRYLKLYQDPPASFAPQVKLAQLFDDLIRLHRLDAKRLPALLERLNLSTHLLQRHSHQVSGGELQRLALARVLLMEPVFLFADEPVSRLDPITARDVLQLLVEVATEYQCAVLLVSHDPALVHKICHTQRCLSPP